VTLRPDEVKEFWDKRARQNRDDAGVTNLEEDEALRELKIAQEQARVDEYLGELPADAAVLDLGGGNGHWAFKLAPRVARVEVVDFCLPLAEDGRARAARAGVTNVHFTHAAAQDYDSPTPFDLIFVSGLLIYLDDDQLAVLAGKVAGYSRPGTVLLLRDGTGIAGRHEIAGRWSEALQANYWALYRTREEYLEVFARVGFTPVKDDDMFPAGSPLNKWAETRLRIYRFERR
jgi:SAM-dependent methyltransferase